MIRRTALPALGLTVALLIVGAVYLGRSSDAPAQSSVLKDTLQQRLLATRLRLTQACRTNGACR